MLDEIHKDRAWKRKVKGLYDLRGASLPLVVTGDGSRSSANPVRRRRRRIW